MKPMELHEMMGLILARPVGNASSSYRNALASTAAVLGDDQVEAHAAWFDYDPAEDAQNVAVGAHIRLITSNGLVTLDHEFSFDGLPDARYVPWRRVKALRVISRLHGDRSRIENAWLETELGNIEFAGADQTLYDSIVKAIRRHLR